jgi:protein tyrosine/serine phosphatase
MDRVYSNAGLFFAEQCERDKARVLVHCMSGKNRLSVSANYVGYLYSLSCFLGIV